VKRVSPWVFALLLTSGCGASPPPASAADAAELIDRAAVAMGTIETVRFSMERSGAPIEISGMEFVSADGQFAAPAATRAVLHVRAGDLSVELGTIGIDDAVWLTNPLTSEWEQLAAGTGFNPAVVFDPALGWVPLLTDDLGEVDYRGIDDPGGGPQHLIHGIIAEERITSLTAGLVSAQSVEADIWIDPADDRITRVVFETVGDAGVSGWVIELSEFDEPVTIGPPAASG
jgi:lipoprotein LprG